VIFHDILSIRNEMTPFIRRQKRKTISASPPRNGFVKRAWKAWALPI